MRSRCEPTVHPAVMRTPVRMDRTELERAVGTGMSIAQLAETFGRSKGSIRYWLRSYGLQTTNRAKRESTDAARAARAAGLKTFV